MAWKRERAPPIDTAARFVANRSHRARRPHKNPTWESSMKNHGLLLSKFGLALGLATGLAAGASHTATAGVPFPRASTPAPLDLGAASALSGNQQITVSVALPLRDSA